VEAAIVQLFVEAKRHQPSVIYIPSLVGWCAAVSETSRSTVRAMLDTLTPTEPILLFAIVDGPFSSLPQDVRAWFGPTRDNRIAFRSPTPLQREEFFLVGLSKTFKDLRMNSQTASSARSESSRCFQLHHLWSHGSLPPPNLLVRKKTISES
jgi:SpoVK/Ycf46/Vps4 family AAA+-type ATPase